MKALVVILPHIKNNEDLYHPYMVVTMTVTEMYASMTVVCRVCLF